MAKQIAQWTCPFCNTRQIVTEENFSTLTSYLSIGKSRHGNPGYWYQAIRCLNDDCNEVTIDVALTAVDWHGPGQSLRATNEISRIRLMPRSNAKPQPDFIPKPIRDDYFEACLIRDDSPKASATLARRALQA